jgi:hypothetical protein
MRTIRLIRANLEQGSNKRGERMAKKSKGKDAKKPSKRPAGEQAAGKTGATQGSSKFQSAFAKIAPPKGFAIKRP